MERRPLEPLSPFTLGRSPAAGRWGADGRGEGAGVAMGTLLCSGKRDGARTSCRVWREKPEQSPVAGVACVYGVVVINSLPVEHPALGLEGESLS